MASFIERLRLQKKRQALHTLLTAASPVDFTIVGRTLMHAALVGVVAGLVGAAFFAGLEYLQRFLLEDLGGYHVLRAAGENFVTPPTGPHPFRPWLIAVLPGIGALASGIISQLAPETRGGGGDAMIDAFHYHGGFIRRRVIWVKALASLFTLGSGGSGGREGPTMQIGAALGSRVGWLLRVSAAERRILMVAGVAAGIAAVFRTPLGAALLAVEVLYRDDFESDALIPAVLASVVAYSIVISIFGESTLFTQPSRFPFVPGHLWLYGIMAVMVAFLANLFLRTLRAVQAVSSRMAVPEWVKPGIGGLALGLFAVPLVLLVGSRVSQPGQGLGLLGGGYGAVQIAISGADWLPDGWSAVALLAGLCIAKVFASSLTIGTGGSAGDFAPSLVIGGLFGGAFGRAVHLISADPRINPAAFALIAMGTFYGGLAHAPLSSLIIVCELAGSYDLLVPLMLAEGIAFVALRHRSLYHAQLPTRRHSPAHSEDSGLIVAPVSGPAATGPPPPPARPPASPPAAAVPASSPAPGAGGTPGTDPEAQ
jgi:CIC family chloride channel protein